MLDQNAAPFTEANFQEALARPRLREAVPDFMPGNRSGGKVRVLKEPELMAMTTQWFEEFESKLEFYEQHGLKVRWLLPWLKEYWWTWQMRDFSRLPNLMVPDARWKDPTTFGRELVGIQEFIDYNVVFFEAIPDWRYDLIPGQTFIDVMPNGDVRMAGRYYGSGHWEGPLLFYPYKKYSPGLWGTGQFIQCTAVDRYHFNAEGLMTHGETLFDIIDGAQSVGQLPGGDSWQFKMMLNASRIPHLAARAKKLFA